LNVLMMQYEYLRIQIAPHYSLMDNVIEAECDITLQGGYLLG
jgi:hypothetical protein